VHLTPVTATRLLVAAAFAVVMLTHAAKAFAAAEPVQFGGLQFDAKSVAFVCDGSRWTQNKFVELKEELGRTMEPLAADQQFAVVFFADDEVKAFNGGALAPATDENRAALKAWLDRLTLGDKSTPQPGLTRGFEAKPDAVVFVSDGRFKDKDDEISAHVDSLNAEIPRRLYTVGFFADDDEDDSRAFVTFMKRLAERNGGAFKAVYANELKRYR
jgi:hypothetical protein